MKILLRQSLVENWPLGVGGFYVVPVLCAVLAVLLCAPFLFLMQPDDMSRTALLTALALAAGMTALASRHLSHNPETYAHAHTARIVASAHAVDERLSPHPNRASFEAYNDV